MIVVSSMVKLGRVLEVFNALHNQGVIRHTSPHLTSSHCLLLATYY